MLACDLFSPASADGMIFRLKRCSPTSYSAFRWDLGSTKWITGDIGMERFLSLPSATPAELLAAGLSMSDLFRQNA
jgi:hypothetical protein